METITTSQSLFLRRRFLNKPRRSDTGFQILKGASKAPFLLPDRNEPPEPSSGAQKVNKTPEFKQGRAL